PPLVIHRSRERRSRGRSARGSKRPVVTFLSRRIPPAESATNTCSESKRETKTEMERADVFIRAPVRIVTVIESHRTDRKFITQADADRVTHVVKSRRYALEGIGRVRQQISSIEENRAQQFAVNREGVLDIEDGKKFAANRMSVIARTEFALGKAAHGVIAAIEEAFVDRNFRGRSAVAVEAVNDPGPRAEREQRSPVRMTRRRSVPDRDEVGDAGRAPDNIDIASVRAR